MILSQQPQPATASPCQIPHSKLQTSEPQSQEYQQPLTWRHHVDQVPQDTLMVCPRSLTEEQMSSGSCGRVVGSSWQVNGQAKLVRQGWFGLESHG